MSSQTRSTGVLKPWRTEALAHQKASEKGCQENANHPVVRT
ncbi:hypothetical protein SAMN00120144_0066 [Hymenobacter roseosalivarius DSM 11622]|uniref:Uncharacterized protein n=1 Tax=Hymenobacter roseosalivarius DSM 11622 TaxID=645990 RepID=A0A1W1W0P8_9BACT|nr:hypothetical protein SAMN00120144_0066 [Hymenobacter roseosalivarius DSM 11622]